MHKQKDVNINDKYTYARWRSCSVVTAGKDGGLRLVAQGIGGGGLRPEADMQIASGGH